MVALIVSYFFLAYVLAPRAIFRLCSGIFLPLRFERTRSDEIAAAFWISVAPLFVTWLGMLTLVGPPAHGTVRHYKEVFEASYLESAFASDPEKFLAFPSKRMDRADGFSRLLLFAGLVRSRHVCVSRSNVWKMEVVSTIQVACPRSSSARRE
jgi:hypothetical protein